MKTKFELEISERLNILNYLYISVKIPKKVLYQNISNLVEHYLNDAYSRPLDYKDILKLYKQIFIINYEPSDYIIINAKFLKKVFLLLRFKFGIKTKIKNLLHFN